MKMNLIKKASRALPSALIIAASSMLLLFANIKNPREYTISLIGADRPTAFFILCLLMSTAAAVNILILMKNSGISSRFIKITAYISNAAMIVASLTATDKYIKGITELHWICALMFMGINPMIILFCIIKKIREGDKKCLIPYGIFMPIYVFDLLYIFRSFALFGFSGGKNGIMELIPLLSTFILLFIFNFETIKKRKHNIKIENI